MITVRIHGGLGNQMFEYALARALSLRAGEDFELDPTSLFDPTKRKYLTPRNYALPIVFNIDPKLSRPSRIVRALKLWYVSTVWRKYYPQLFAKLGVWRYVKEKSFPFDPEILELRGNVYLDGFWQTEKYFKDYEDIIRKDFTFRNALPGETAEVAERIKGSNAVCLHVRRTDAANNPVAQKVHTLAPMSYYERAVATVKKHTKDPIKVFVFSDDIPWCRENVKIDADHEFVGDEHSGVEAQGHLHLMSLCKHFIIPESSFSWWAAWLSSNKNKVVVAPDPWFKVATIDTKDLLPEGWIKLQQYT